MNIIKNKDFLYPLILCIILAVLLSINYIYFGSIIYDCGREFLVPEAMNNGKVLIKDIFITYFPLSYQINSVFMKLFGAKLDTFRVMGCIVCLIDIVFYYKIARFFTNETKSFIIAFCSAIYTMFNVSYLFNYVLGYSYAYIYATAFFIIAIYYAILYIKSNEKKPLFISVLLSGVCFALKAEFIFLIIPYIIFLLYKKENWKNIFITFGLFVLPVILSFCALFLSGFSFNDFIKYIEFMKNFMSSDILAHYTHVVTRKDPARWLELNKNSFVWFVNCFAVFYAVLILPVIYNKKLIFWVLTALLLAGYSAYAVSRGGFIALSMFVYISITAILAVILFIILYKMNKLNNKIKLEAVVFIILMQLALIVRHNFIYTANHSAYTMGIAILAFIVYLEILVTNKNFNKIFTTFMLMIGIINAAYFSVYNILFTKYTIKTDKGTMKLPLNEASEITSKTINFMNNIDEDKTVLILPEGHMLNFLANKKTNLKYYQLLPNHIEALSEDKIIEGLEKNKPDYILFQTENYGIYGTPYICNDFAQKICSFTLKNYNLIKVFANSGFFMISVYKVK